jgi:hypothetical protein
MMSSDTKQNADFWEQLDATSYYRPLAVKTVDQFLSGEVENVFINQDMGKWWLKVDGVNGEAPHDSLEAAKAAGDAVIIESENAMTDRMLSDLGLSTDEWKMEISEGLPLVKLLIADDIVLLAGETHPRWSLLQGNDFIIETDDFAAALAKAKDLVSGPSPTF